MKWVLACFLATIVVGCGSSDEPELADGLAPATVAETEGGQPANSEVTDDKIGLTVYPGAKEVDSSRVKLVTDLGESYSVSYTTSSTPLEVAAFYKAELAKLGTLQDGIATGDSLQSVAVDRTDGTQSAVKAMTDSKGITVVSIHRFFPKK